MSNPFLRLFGTAVDLVRGQDATDASLRTKDPIQIDAALTTSPQDVAHKLGRAPQGFTVVSNPNGLSVVQGTTSRPDLFLRLSCASGSGTVRIEVY